MRIEVSKLDEPISNVSAVFQPGEVDPGDETVTLKDEIKFTGAIEKHILRVDIDGNIKTTAQINCSRCLKPLETGLDISFRSSFIPAEFETQEQEVEVRGDDLDVEFYDDDEIDLAEVVREQIILNVPQAVLCTSECLGLCEKCGANKNEKNCDCSEREIDPRLKVLENLIREKKD